MTIDRAIVDHVEVSEDDRKLAVKPPTPGVELSKGQAIQLVRSIASDLETHARSGLGVAANVTKFINGNGAEAIDEGWRAYPFAYLGGVIGVEADYIRRLHRAGQVLQEIQRKPIGLQPRNPHQLTPMYRMIVDGRGDEIPKAWALADEIRSNDLLTWQGDKKHPPKQINAEHVRKAVKNLLGPATARTGKSSTAVADELPQDPEPAPDKNPDTEQKTPRAPGRGGWVRDLWQAAAKWVDRLNEDRNTPPDLRAALELVLKLSWKLAHAPEPDKDTNSLWTPNNKSSDLAHGGLGPVTPQKKSTGEQRAHTGTSLASSRADQVLPSRSQSR